MTTAAVNADRARRALAYRMRGDDTALDALLASLDDRSTRRLLRAVLAAVGDQLAARCEAVGVPAREGADYLLAAGSRVHRAAPALRGTRSDHTEE